MLYWIFEQFRSYDGLFSKLTNVFQYESFRSVAACVFAFVVTLLLGDRVIRKLISLKIGQPVRTKEEVNQLYELHGKKAGTPTMGGILIIASVVVASLCCSRWDNPFLWLVLFVTVGLGALGF